MNVFRLVGDLSHLLAIIILLAKIWRTRSCAGISGKSQLLFALVFTFRYLDLFTNFVSPYNTIMKVFFIVTTYGTLYLIFIKFKATYDSNHDSFRAEFLLIPAVGLALLVNHDFSALEILWTLSIYLESVAIMPQLYMITKTGEAENIIFYYLFALGAYRAMYILNWCYRYYMEDFYDWIAIVAGCVQTALYIGGFYLYITKAFAAPPAELPKTSTAVVSKTVINKEPATPNMTPSPDNSSMPGKLTLSRTNSNDNNTTCTKVGGNGVCTSVDPGTLTCRETPANCTVPIPPSNGSLVDCESLDSTAVEGTVLTYQCDNGLVLTGTTSSIANSSLNNGTTATAYINEGANVTHIVSTLDELVRNNEDTTDGEGGPVESLKERMKKVSVQANTSTTAL